MQHFLVYLQMAIIIILFQCDYWNYRYDCACVKKEVQCLEENLNIDRKSSQASRKQARESVVLVYSPMAVGTTPNTFPSCPCLNPFERLWAEGRRDGAKRAKVANCVIACSSCICLISVLTSSSSSSSFFGQISKFELRSQVLLIFVCLAVFLALKKYSVPRRGIWCLRNVMRTKV